MPAAYGPGSLELLGVAKAMPVRIVSLSVQALRSKA